MELNEDMLNELRAESAELVERFARVWLSLNTSVEQGRAVSRDDVDELFRSLHSLKSLSEIANRQRLVSALHLIEDRLTKVREGQSSLEIADLEVLAEAQLVLEKIFVGSLTTDDDVLMAELEDLAQKFCLGSPQVLVQTPKTQTAKIEEISADETSRVEAYRAREEMIFALSGEGNSEDIRARILPIGDLLVQRSVGEKYLFIFAAELEQSLVEAIVENSVQLVQKDVLEVSAFMRSWASSCGETVDALPQQTSQVSLSEKIVNSTPAEHAISVSDAIEHGESVESESTDSADPEMVADFLMNASELLETLTQSLLELETNPNDSSTIENIFRAAHTIKGTSGMLGFSTIEKLCHVLENTFDRIRRGQLSATPVLVDQLLVGWDKVRELFSMLERGQKPSLPIDQYLQQLFAAEKGVTAVKPPKEEQPAASTQKNESQGTIRVDLKRLDSLVNLVGELVIDRTRFARIEEAMRTRGASADLSHQMAESVLLFGRHMNEVQNIIMKVRMVPVGNVFYKFARMVRDLGRQTGKEVDLVIEGGETELDKTLVEDLGDPLVHLIRNSVDHGIESPEVRESKGKSRRGQIRLNAAQQGNMIVISVSDDGNGLDVDRIRAKAIKNGLIKESDQIPAKDIFNLIFEAGFSTAEKVTNISGRGVGMDVVKKNIQKLKGVIEINSESGRGTTIMIKLPITLAIVPSLMVEVKGENFAIPLVNVIESIRIDPSEIQQMGSSQFVKLREQVVPIVNFADVLGLNGMAQHFWYRVDTPTSTLRRRRERLVFVVIGIGPERLGLVVDRLVGQQEIVIKSLGRLLRNHSSLAGGCVMGDGRVALVLDVAEIFGQDGMQRGAHARRAS